MRGEDPARDVGGRALEGARAGEELVEDDAQAVDVGARVDRVAAEELGRGGVGGAEALPGAREAAVVAGLAGQAEVDEARAAGAVVEHDVLRRDVAVEDAGPVRDLERLRQLGHELRRLGRGHGPALLDLLAQRRPGHVLHDDVEAVLVAVDLEHAGEAGVRQARGEPRLAQRARLGLGVEARRQELEGEVALDPRPVGQEHRPAPPLADDRQELVRPRLPERQVRPVAPGGRAQVAHGGTVAAAAGRRRPRRRSLAERVVLGRALGGLSPGDGPASARDRQERDVERGRGGEPGQGEGREQPVSRPVGHEQVAAAAELASHGGQVVAHPAEGLATRAQGREGAAAAHGQAQEGAEQGEGAGEVHGAARLQASRRRATPAAASRAR
ncbi:MAG: hypothetical protein M9894_23910 [Planctomycetes bacterium]|nr:hypothetical protein [Planctomycetota bacterium]